MRAGWTDLPQVFWGVEKGCRAALKCGQFHPQGLLSLQSLLQDNRANPIIYHVRKLVSSGPPGLHTHCLHFIYRKLYLRFKKRLNVNRKYCLQLQHNVPVSSRSVEGHPVIQGKTWQEEIEKVIWYRNLYIVCVCVSGKFCPNGYLEINQTYIFLYGDKARPSRVRQTEDRWDEVNHSIRIGLSISIHSYLNAWTNLL